MKFKLNKRKLTFASQIYKKNLQEVFNMKPELDELQISVLSPTGNKNMNFTRGGSNFDFFFNH